MISENLEKTLHGTFQAAQRGRYALITVEFLLLCLLDDPDAKPVLEACGAKFDKMRQELTTIIEAETPIVEGADESRAPGDIDSQPTRGFQRVIQRAILHVQASGKKKVTGANCVVAIFGEKDSKAVVVLTQQGITRFDVVNFMAHGIVKGVVTASAEDKVQLAFRVDGARDSGKSSNELRLFVSYCHVDAACLQRLLVHLKPLERQGLIDCWADTKLRAGDKWRQQLNDNLMQSAVAVLLVSADFLASDFIVKNELPPILLKAEAQGLRILPVILKPCGFHRDKALQSFQAINDPSSPLLGMSPIRQEALYDKLAGEVYREIELRRARSIEDR